MTTANTRQTIVVLNMSNMAGYVNNFIPGQKTRIDYKKLLKHAANNREIIGALCVSQYDTVFMTNKSEEYRNKNKKFLSSLKSLGWSPLQVQYNMESKDTDPVFQGVWREIYTMLMDENDEPKYDFSNIDLVFVSGVASWMQVIKPFYINGFSIEILFPKKGLSAELSRLFVTRDLNLESLIVNTFSNV